MARHFDVWPIFVPCATCATGPGSNQIVGHAVINSDIEARDDRCHCLFLTYTALNSSMVDPGRWSNELKNPGEEPKFK